MQGLRKMPFEGRPGKTWKQGKERWKKDDERRSQREDMDRSLGRQGGSWHIYSTRLQEQADFVDDENYQRWILISISSFVLT